MDLDQRQRSGRAAHLAIHVGMDGLHDRTLARAARAPQQGVVGRQALGEALRVFQQGGFLMVDALQELDRHAIDLGHGFQPVPGGVPDIGLGGGDVGACRRRRSQPVERFGDA